MKSDKPSKEGTCMRKWIWIGVFALLVAGIGHFLIAGNSSAILANVQPTTLYWDGKAVTGVDSSGYFHDGTRYLPAALEYKGVTYVPLSLIGRHLNKPTGRDEASHSAWLGQAPGAAKRPSPQQTGPAAVKLPPAQSATAPAETKRPAPNTSASLFGISLGMPAEQVVKVLGKPARQEPSGLGYQWWIYNRDPARYLQVGISDGKVVDIYSNAPQAKTGNASIGTSLPALVRHYDIAHTVSFSYMNAHVQITNQKYQRPLVIVDGIPHIFYLDKQNGDKVTAIRLIDTLMLLRGSFYETKWTYQGEAPNFDPPPLSVKEREQVNTAMERQLLDLVNVVRYRYKLPLLTWSDQAARVARQHSRDMESHGFFDHVSATTGLNPFQRLQKAGIAYSMAGENIAAGYPDAIEAHESWMNSPGHRKNVLEKGFAQLGAGVATDYYTQTFLTLKQ
jgi:uncharacterized protein YkwD